MGIRKYHNKWRLYCHDQDGNLIQKYLDSEEQAKELLEFYTANKNNITRNKKRCNASDQDLPVGLEDYHYTSKSSCGGNAYEYLYVAIKATVFINGKAKCRMRNYGRKRTRAEAIEICHKWRLEQVAIIEGK
ncbi:MAG: hypothetical protein ACR2PH_08920 [Desulfobulbia bacterium]